MVIGQYLNKLDTYLARGLANFENKNIPAYSLLVFCFLVVFTFYPFALGYEIDSILKRGLFVFGGVLSLGYVGLSIIYQPINFLPRFFFWSLILISGVAIISTILSPERWDALTGLTFELDTLFVTLSFVFLTIAASIAFQNWKGDIGLLFTLVLGVGLILPATVLSLAGIPNYWQHLFIDTNSLQILALFVILGGAYQLDFNFSITWFAKVLIVVFITSAFIHCLQNPMTVLMALGFGTSLCLVFHKIIYGNKGSGFIPLVNIFTLILFLLLTIYSFSSYAIHKVENQRYFNEIHFTKDALMLKLQWDRGDYLIGSGPHTYTQFWDLYRPHASYNDFEAWGTTYEIPFIYNEPRYAFGLVPTLVLNTGILGLLSWGLFIGGCLYLGWRRLGEFIQTYNSLGSSVVISLVFILSIIFVVPQIYILAIGAISVGATLGRVTKKTPLVIHSVISSCIKLIIALAIIAFTGALLFYSQKIVDSSLYFQKTVDIWLKDDELPHQHVDELIKLRPRPEFHRLLAYIKLDSAIKYLSGDSEYLESNKETVQKFLAESLLSASTAVALDKNDYRNLVLTGDILTFLYMFGAGDSFELGKSHYDKAIGIINIQPVAHLGLARLMSMRGEQALALKEVEEALRIRPGWPEALSLKDEIINKTITAEQ